MTVEEAISFIHQRTWRGSKPGLSRTKRLLTLLGEPQRRLQFIHVAGTNGKGSTSAMLSGILTASGLKTGLYTSPYISRFNERIQLDGVPIADAALAEITERIAPLALSMDDRPTEFEIVTAIAIEFFARERCDIVALETGMGGRLDSTNVIDAPVVSIITNIGIDHTRELGGTAVEIAGEKAGIIKKGCPAVIYDLPDRIREVFASRCAEMSAKLTSADFSAITPISDSLDGQAFSYKSFKNLFLPLLGRHQLKNAAVALETVTQLRTRGFDISDAAVKSGLEHTRWPARFELLSRNPAVVLDGGHNPQCAETVAENLRRYFPCKKTILLFGVLSGKDYSKMAETLNTAADSFVTITPPNPLALPATELAKCLEPFGKPVFICDSVTGGIEKALALADDNSVVCAVGSLYSAGAVRAYFVG